ncbi:MAG: CARDB domain-containing protein [Nanoarchaeota archaeon]
MNQEVASTMRFWQIAFALVALSLLAAACESGLNAAGKATQLSNLAPGVGGGGGGGNGTNYTCSDSDGGRIYVFQGTTCKGPTCRTDVCQSVYNLREYYCYNNNIANETKNCTSIGPYFKCYSGRCRMNQTGTDLLAINITLEPPQPIAGQPFYFYYTFKNNGVTSIPANAFVNRYCRSGTNCLNELWITALNPGDTRSMSKGPYTYTAGSYQATLAVDYGASLIETNENNNLVRKNYNVISPPPPQNETHLACVGMTCQLVNGSGPNNCTNNNDCRHLACVGESCTYVAGQGSNLCTYDCACKICDVNDVLAEGETGTFTAEGRDYEITADLLDVIYARFIVNGESSPLLGECETYRLVDGSNITVMDIYNSTNGTNSTDMVRFCLNAAPQQNVSNTSCADSDGGQNWNVTGRVYGNYSNGSQFSVWDYCDYWRILREQYCIGLNPYESQHWCGEGFMCEGGRCVVNQTNQSNVTQTCIDSDGLNYYFRGRVYGESGDGPYEVWDSCRNSSHVSEWVCNDEFPTNLPPYYCMNGCANGACGNQTNLTYAWTNCTTLQNISCNTLCQGRGMVCGDVCTTTRGYPNWGAEAWYTTQTCMNGTNGSGQVHCNSVVTDEPYIDRWKCCCGS